MFSRKISDLEFIESFLSFGFGARPAISHLLLEKLYDDDYYKTNDIKAILLQSLENYYYLTEILLMIMFSLKEKKRNTSKPFLSIYNSRSIRENATRQSSENLIHELEELDNESFLKLFCLPSTPDLLESFSNIDVHSLTEIFGSIEQAEKQFLTEVKDLRISIMSAISNRIMLNTGESFPLYKMLNKLKHGYQAVEDESENVLSIVIDCIEEMNGEGVYSVIEIPIKKTTIEFFTEQSKLLALIIRQILFLYRFNLIKQDGEL